MTHALREPGPASGRPRVARLMRENELKNRRPRRFRRVTDSGHAFPVAATPLLQDFMVAGLDRKWGSDISYIWTREGWLYLAVVCDLYFRRNVGWAADNQPHKELALTVLRCIFVVRQSGPDLIRRPDHGSRYCSNGYRKERRRNGALTSLSGRENYYNSTMVESPSSRRPATWMAFTIPAAATRRLASPAPHRLRGTPATQSLPIKLKKSITISVDKISHLNFEFLKLNSALHNFYKILLEILIRLPLLRTDDDT